MKKVGILMGSDSDLPVVQKAIDVLRELDIPFEAHVMSAHRTPEAAASFAKGAIEGGFGVLIGAAGMAAHLAGALAANTVLPVIGLRLRCPGESRWRRLRSTAGPMRACLRPRSLRWRTRGCGIGWLRAARRRRSGLSKRTKSSRRPLRIS